MLTTEREMFAQLRLQAMRQDTASRWMPAAGDVLTGILERVATHEGHDGTEYLVLHLRQEDDSRVTVNCTTVLRRLFDESKAEPGDGLVIAYLGEVKSRRGYTYKQFTLDAIHAQEGPLQ